MSCQENKKTDEVDKLNDTIYNTEGEIKNITDYDATDPVENTIQEGVNEIQKTPAQAALTII